MQHIIEKAMVPFRQSPNKIINKERAMVFVPKAGLNKPGIAGYNPKDFTVSEGIVSLKNAWKLEPTTVTETTSIDDIREIGSYVVSSTTVTDLPTTVRAGALYVLKFGSSYKQILFTNMNRIYQRTTKTYNSLTWDDWKEVANNIEDGTSSGAIQQIADKVANGFDFTGINPNATAQDASLTGTIPYGATGVFASAFGGKCRAEGKRSHAEGTTTIAKGKYSHAEGDSSVTLGDASHAEGYRTVAVKINSHAEGEETIAQEQASHAEGYKTKALGIYAHAEGHETTALGGNSHAEGFQTQALKTNGHAEGSATKAIGIGCHAEGYNTQAGDGSSAYAHAEGYETQALANNSHAEGVEAKALANGCHAEGYGTTAGDANDDESSRFSHAEGLLSSATKIAAHAEGSYTEASGDSSHAEGYQSKATNNHSHAEGRETISSGNSSHSEGYQTKAEGDYSHASGLGTIASNRAEHAVGKYNAPKDDTLFVVGYGTDNSNRKNALEVTKDGDVRIYDGSSSMLSLFSTLDNIRALLTQANSDLFVFVNSLPEVGEKNKIYVVPAQQSQEGNVYDEYHYIKDGANSRWEYLGSNKLDIDLTEFVKFTDRDTFVKEGITENTQTLLPEEQASACEWLGAAGKKWVEEYHSKNRNVFNITQIDTIYASKNDLPDLGANDNGKAYLVINDEEKAIYSYSYNSESGTGTWAKKDDLKANTTYVVLGGRSRGIFRYTMAKPYLIKAEQMQVVYVTSIDTVYSSASALPHLFEYKDNGTEFIVIDDNKKERAVYSFVWNSDNDYYWYKLDDLREHSLYVVHGGDKKGIYRYTMSSPYFLQVAPSLEEFESVVTEPNPSGNATETLNKLKIGKTIYNLPSGTGGGVDTKDLSSQKLLYWNGTKFVSLPTSVVSTDGKQVLFQDNNQRLVLQNNQAYLEDNSDANNKLKAHLSAIGGLTFSNKEKRVIYGYNYIGVDPYEDGKYNDAKRQRFYYPTKQGTLLTDEDINLNKILTDDDIDTTAYDLPKIAGFKPNQWVLNEDVGNGLLNSILYENISDSSKKLIVLDFFQTSDETVKASPSSVGMFSNIGKWQSSGIRIDNLVSYSKFTLADSKYVTLADFPYITVDKYQWIVKPEYNVDNKQFMNAVIFNSQIYDAISDNGQATIYGLALRYDTTNDSNAFDITKSVVVSGKHIKLTLQNFI
jgi:hypothetical protein